jgi:hypothetical protein
MADRSKQIRELISSAESEGTLSGEGFLGEALGQAIASLEELQGDRDLFDPTFSAEAQGAEYAAMFATIAEGFESLFAELSLMRSSYISSELIPDVPAADGGTSTFEQIIDAEATFESYENVFFRMLGMPSSSDLAEDRPIMAVSSSGELTQDNYGLVKEDYEESILDVRQLTRDSRPVVVDNSVYDFLSASHDPVERLTRAGFTKSEELTQILELLSTYVGIADQRSEQATEIVGQIQDIAAGAGAEGITILRHKYVTAAVQEQAIDRVNSWADQSGDPEARVQVHATANLLADCIIALEPSASTALNDELMNRIWKREVLGQDEPTLMGLHLNENFWKFSYLLFPPIQDGRISSCINEPQSRIAEPFMPQSLRTINGNIMRSSLLEAVIRLRIDSVTGTTISPPTEGAMAPVSVGVQSKNIEYSDIQEQMGLLESLVVVRLFSALHGMAVDVRNKIKEMHFLQHQSGSSPAHDAPDSDNRVVETEKRAFCDKNDRQCRIETVKLIEDSLMLLFGDPNSPETLNLQTGIARNSGVKNAHLMSSVLSSISIPSRWAEAELEKIEEELGAADDKGASRGVSRVSSVMGISKGVGAIDVMAFTVALFTASEKTLLSLLNERQFGYLQNEFPKKYFDTFERIPMEDAVNEIGIVAYDAYQFFRYALRIPGGIFVYNETPEDNE